MLGSKENCAIFYILRLKPSNTGSTIEKAIENLYSHGEDNKGRFTAIELTNRNFKETVFDNHKKELNTIYEKALDGTGVFKISTHMFDPWYKTDNTEASKVIKLGYLRFKTEEIALFVRDNSLDVPSIESRCWKDKYEDHILSKVEFDGFGRYRFDNGYDFLVTHRLSNGMGSYTGFERNIGKLYEFTQKAIPNSTTTDFIDIDIKTMDISFKDRFEYNETNAIDRALTRRFFGW